MASLPDLEDYRRDAEAFTEELNRAWYEHSAGHTDELPLDTIYERHHELFSADIAQAFLDAADGASGDRARSYRTLGRFAAEGTIGAASRAQTRAVAELEASTVIAWEGAQVGFREVSAIVANDDDRDHRKTLSRRLYRVLDHELNPAHRDVWDTRHAAARTLGAPSYRALFERLSGLDFDKLAQQGRGFLDATESLFERRFDSALREHSGVGLTGANVSDIPRLMRSGPYDERFPAKHMLGIFEQTLDGLGLDLRAQPNIHLDVEARPKKDPRAFCAPVRVPDEVYLVIAPAGGLDDYSALLHEAGHAEHFACVSRGLPFEFRCLGDDAITECFAFTMEWLLADPAWLEHTIGGRDNDDIVDHLAVQRLFFQRRSCAKFLYELEFHGAGVDGAGARYAEILTDGVRIEWPAERHLEDIDESFYVLSYLRAWTLATSLSVMLREQFGRRWFTQKKAGHFLREIWEDGQRLTAEELASELGLPQPDIMLLAEEAERLLGG